MAYRVQKFSKGTTGRLGGWNQTHCRHVISRDFGQGDDGIDTIAKDSVGRYQREVSSKDTLVDVVCGVRSPCGDVVEKVALQRHVDGYQGDIEPTSHVG